jgi:PIN domain nuclease of toxin-antitoxin system
VRYLLDTHLLIWLALGDSKLPREVAVLHEDPENDLYFSVISVWETAIKQALGRKDFQADAGLLRAELLNEGYKEILVESRHAIEVRNLPQLHRDPFDRMLIAQSRVEGLVLLTSDEDICKYLGTVKRV